MKTPPLLHLALASTLLLCVVPPGGAQSFEVPTPRSPQAAGYDQYSDVPVDLRHGTVNYSVPLTVVSTDGASVPISLEYSARGIRVADTPSWVGQGWTLNAGGAVSRSVRGLDDLLPQGFPYTGHHVLEDYQQAPPLSDLFLDRIYSGGWDTEPDDFSVNAPGVSANFLFAPSNWDGDCPPGEALCPVTVPFVPVDIAFLPQYDPSADSGDRLAWIVTGTDGTVYEFSAPETTVTAAGITPTFFKSAWYLTRVSPPTGGDIRLYYDDHYTSFYGGVTKSRYAHYDGTCPIPDGGSSSSPYNVYTKTVRAIASERDSVVFVRSAHNGGPLSIGGQDQQVKLDRIDVFEPGGPVRHRVRLDYTVVGGDGGRLFLDSLRTESPSGDEVGSRYAFEYDRREALPGFTDRAIDHWGFYNGADNGSGTLPDTVVPNQFGGAGYQLVGDGADREPSGDALAGMLTEVTLPTGGAVRFEYGLHDYGKVGHDEATRPRPQFRSVQATINDPDDSEAFEVVAPSGAPPVPVTFSVQKDCVSNNRFECLSQIIVRDTRDDSERSLAPNDETTLLLEPNVTYQLVAEVTSPGNSSAPDNFISGTARWDDEVPAGTPGALPALAGGARIESVTADDGSGIASRTRYTYRSEDDPSRSSGVLAVEPGYRQYVGADVCKWSLVTSAPRVRSRGSHVSYEHVTAESDLVAAGSVQSAFRNPLSVPYPDNWSTVWGLPTNYEWLRGQPTSSETLAENGQEVRTSTYEYRQSLGPPIKGLKFRFVPYTPNDNALQPVSSVFPTGPDGEIQYWFYDEPTGYILRDRMVEVQY